MLEPGVIAAVLAIYGLAGVVKGVVGLGLPTVTLALLVPVLGLAPAVALTFVPTLVTNAWQAVAGGRFWAILRRLWPMFAAAVVACLFGTAVLAAADTSALAGLLGALLAAYALMGLTAPPIPTPGRAEAVLAPIAGLAAGLMAGMVGSFTMPGIVYLQSLRLARDELVQAMGIIFFALSLTLGAGLAHHGLINTPLLLLSLACVPSALLGMEAGRRIRRHLPEARFRRLFFAALLALGLNMVAGAILASGASSRTSPDTTPTIEPTVEETGEVGAQMR